MDNETKNYLASQIDMIAQKISSIQEKNPSKRLGIKISKGISETACTRLCQYLDFESPPDCLEWLAICNGIEGGCIQNLYGHDSIMEHCTISEDVYEGWKKLQYFPLGNDRCGDYYYAIPFKKGGETYFPVVFVEGSQPGQELGKCTHIMASSVPIFLKYFLQLIQYELRYFYDEGGKSYDFWWPYDKDLVLRNDPEIASFNITLPWEEED